MGHAGFIPSTVRTVCEKAAEGGKENPKQGRLYTNHSTAKTTSNDSSGTPGIVSLLDRILIQVLQQP